MRPVTVAYVVGTTRLPAASSPNMPTYKGTFGTIITSCGIKGVLAWTSKGTLILISQAIKIALMCKGDQKSASSKINCT